MRLTLTTAFLTILFSSQNYASVFVVGSSETYKSISSAVNAAQPGDTILVRAGKYGPAYLSKTGTEGKMLTIKNYPGELPEINGWNGTTLNGGQAFSFPSPAQYIRVEGFYVTGFRFGLISANWTSVSEEERKTFLTGNNIEIRFNVVDLCGMNGMSIFYTKNVTFENNLVSRTGWEDPTHSWSSGINLLGDGGTVIVRNNISFHHVDISTNHSDGNGFIIDQSFDKITSGLIENNIAFLNGGSGFGTNQSANISYIGNTTYNNYQDDSFASRGAGGISFSNPESRNTGAVRNNLCIQINRGEPIIVYGAALSSLKGVSNNFTSKTAADAASIFVNADECDFRIKGSASQIVGKGMADGISTFDNGFDPKAIKREVSSKQPFYTFAPDIDYIKSKGGLAGCFSPTDRNTQPCIGAYEYTPLSTVNNNSFVNSNNDQPTFRTFNNSSVVSFSKITSKNKYCSLIDLMGRSSMNYIINPDDVHAINVQSYCSGKYILRLSKRE